MAFIQVIQTTLFHFTNNEKTSWKLRRLFLVFLKKKEQKEHIPKWRWIHKLAYLPICIEGKWIVSCSVLFLLVVKSKMLYVSTFLPPF